MSGELRDIVLALEQATNAKPYDPIYRAVSYAERAGWIGRPTHSTALRMIVGDACVDAALLLMRPEWHVRSGRGFSARGALVWGCVIELPGVNPPISIIQVGRAEHHHSHACAIVLAAIEAYGEGQ
ncbi:MAG: hypothetical protein ACEQSH_00360 [Bacteroidia bacterium]